MRSPIPVLVFVALVGQIASVRSIPLVRSPNERETQGQNQEAAERAAKADQELGGEHEASLAVSNSSGISSLSGHKEKQQQADVEQICLLPGCVKAANEILKNMDDTVDPCDDFYRYSCGNWVDSQVIPDDKSSISRFTMIQEELDNKLITLIDREPQFDEPPFVEKMRNLYESCMDTDRLETLGNEPILDVIRKLGGWPVLGESSGWTRERQHSFDWLDLQIKFRQMGLFDRVLFGFSVKLDIKDIKRTILQLSQASIQLSSNDLSEGLNDPLVAAYYELIVDSAVMLGANRREAEQQMLDALNFEANLLYILSTTKRAGLKDLYNKMTMGQLSNLAPNIDWNRYLASVLDEPLGSDEEITVLAPDFIAQLDKLLVAIDSVTLANYMMWRMVLSTVHFLGHSWRERIHAYNSKITGQPRERPRSEQCFGQLKGYLDTALSSMYAKNYFKADSKQRTMEMVDDIRHELITILDEVDWMDEGTRREAKAKANAIGKHIGYPDELLNDTIIEQFYSGLELERGKYYDNVLHIQKWFYSQSFKRLHEPNLRADWRNHARAATVNAQYQPQDNSIELPAGILQGVCYDKDRPNYLNFGAIGSIIGHELTHGFDNLGRQFDKEGNHRDWWGAETDSNFRERAQCFIEQYGNFTVPGTELKVNGVNTLGENIADNGGLKEAFRAYKRWVSRHGVEPKLPGLKLNQEQLFFVSTANVWCTKMRPEMQQLLVAIDTHSPSQLRVTGTMSNMREFSEAFNCPAGAPMNPAKKCSVW